MELRWTMRGATMRKRILRPWLRCECSVACERLVRCGTARHRSNRLLTRIHAHAALHTGNTAVRGSNRQP